MIRLIKGCTLMLGLITFGPLLVFAVTPSSLRLGVLLGLGAGAVLVVEGLLWLGGSGLLMFLAGRKSVRRR